MTARAVWAPEAESDLEAIVYHIAIQDGRPAVAEKIAHELRDKCASYANYPLTGESEPRLGTDCRRFRYKRWAVFYKPIETGIAVLRIVDGARDFDRLFESS